MSRRHAAKIGGVCFVDLDAVNQLPDQQFHDTFRDVTLPAPSLLQQLKGNITHSSFVFYQNDRPFQCELNQLRPERWPFQRSSPIKCAHCDDVIAPEAQLWPIPIKQRQRRKHVFFVCDGFCCSAACSRAIIRNCPARIEVLVSIVALTRQDLPFRQDSRLLPPPAPPKTAMREYNVFNLGISRQEYRAIIHKSEIRCNLYEAPLVPTEIFLARSTSLLSPNVLQQPFYPTSAVAPAPSAASAAIVPIKPSAPAPKPAKTQRSIHNLMQFKKKQAVVK